MTQAIKKRLEYLRGEIETESISTAEIAELQSLAEHIDKGDVLLLQWAGVPEHEEDKEEFSIYDSGEEHFDRYTLFVGGSVFGMSINANSPQGFNQYLGDEDEMPESEEVVGKKVGFKELPEQLQKAIMERVSASREKEGITCPLCSKWIPYTLEKGVHTWTCGECPFVGQEVY
jgi:hypothetical protein